jgi:hypothetical protein
MKPEREAMAETLTRVTKMAGGEAPEFMLMSAGNWAWLSWEYGIPKWVKLKWRQRRSKPNGYVATMVRRFRIRHGTASYRIVRL